jgi:hypothetical protein
MSQEMLRPGAKLLKSIWSSAADQVRLQSGVVDTGRAALRSTQLQTRYYSFGIAAKGNNGQSVDGQFAVYRRCG